MVNSIKEKATKIRLVVSDIDGTLVPNDKELTQESIEAAQELKKAGIQLCLVSSRPPQGIQLFFKQLHITTPFAALNGGEIIGNNSQVLSSVEIDRGVVIDICDILRKYNIGIWILGGFDWCVFNNMDDHFTQREIKIIGMQPKILQSLDHYQERVVKVQATSTDTALLDKVAQEIEAKHPGKIKALRSSDHYLDITHPLANKGHAALDLGKQLGIDISETACIGDMNNDIPMLEIAGLSISMGQSNDDVKKHAHYVTETNENNGWAHAIRKYILPRV